MKRHWLGIVVLFVLVSVVFGLALALGYPYVAYGALVVGLTTTVVLSVAWLRPEGKSVEHHPAVDRVFDDMDP